jgi:hypothetical protein
MPKVRSRSARIAGLLLGTTLVTASILAGGPATAVVTVGHNAAGHIPRAGILALMRHGGPGGSPVPVPGHAWTRPLPAWPSSGRSGHALAPPAGVPSPGTDSGLIGIFCPSATNCWAVGTYFNGTASLDEVLHWNGSNWAQVAAPSPGGTGNGAFSELSGGRCTAPNNCWAVGDYDAAGGARLDLVLHWNGTKWSKVAAPSPGGTGTASVSTLADVACRSSSSCWTAGQYGIVGGGIQAIRNNVLHWNGTKWVQVNVPNPAGTGNGDINELASIRCPANNDCWAVGTAGLDTSTYLMLNQALHWDGTTWIQATLPSPGGTANGDFSSAKAMACTSYANCWVGGYYRNVLGGGAVLNQLLHWDGTAWTQATVPQPGGTSGIDGDLNETDAVDCASASDCWAVGAYSVSSGGYDLNQALHWDGTTWSQAVTPSPGGIAPDAYSALIAVHCAGTTNCWAVGSSEMGASGPYLNQALRWNGSTWSIG